MSVVNVILLIDVGRVTESTTHRFILKNGIPPLLLAQQQRRRQRDQATSRQPELFRPCLWYLLIVHWN